MVVTLFITQRLRRTGIDGELSIPGQRPISSCPHNTTHPSPSDSPEKPSPSPRHPTFQPSHPPRASHTYPPPPSLPDRPKRSTRRSCESSYGHGVCSTCTRRGLGRGRQGGRRSRSLRSIWTGGNRRRFSITCFSAFDMGGSQSDSRSRCSS